MTNEHISISLPAGAVEVTDALASAGFACHIVGGCVRDSILGVDPHDWDLTTPATVDEMHDAFEAAGLPVHDTGAQHGTITVVAKADGVPYEVTTYRADGSYTDGRHPDCVSFVDDIEMDLARRDLTINAMAWSQDGGLVDQFGGMADLRSGTIRCVGDPMRRLSEDYLRIMRVLRFATRLGFSIDHRTGLAVHELREGLAFVSQERKRKELTGILSSEHPDALAEVLREYRDVIFEVIPELSATAETLQRHPWHRPGSVWDHTVAVVASTPPDPIVRMAALLHDSGKPACLSIDDDGVTHFQGHPAVSAEIAGEVLDRLHVDARTRHDVTLLVAQHDREIPATERGVRRALVRFGSREMFDRWVMLRRADVMGQSDYAQEQELPHVDAIEGIARELEEREGMFSMSEMALRGADLLMLGMAPGPAVGEILREAFDRVLDGEMPNEHDVLMAFAAERAGVTLPDQGCNKEHQTA